ncbi:MAG: hypothetical protein JXR97_01600 [Planctomycetes bacterium]|nr:hypothetical protein [Planctomycetota bacterium]
MNDWKSWLKEGRQYLCSASGKNGKPSKFSPVIQYNLLSMSLESYVMAILDYHHSLPYNHTFTDLMEGMDKVCPLEKGLRSKILEIEKAQNICSFSDFTVAQIDAECLIDFRKAVTEIGLIAISTCKEKVLAAVS